MVLNMRVLNMRNLNQGVLNMLALNELHAFFSAAGDVVHLKQQLGLRKWRFNLL
jgi:hypothetical protein